MTKTKRQVADPLEKLHKHFSSAARYGDRWEKSLYPALIGSTQYTALRNQYAAIEENDRFMGDAQSVQRVSLPSSMLTCYVRPLDGSLTAKKPFPEPEKSSNGLNTHWNLDLASILAVSALEVQSGHKVLDLCAAPGGKSVALAQSIFASSTASGCLHSNEYDYQRMRRLDENLRQYIPDEHRRAKRSVCLHLDGTSATLVCPSGIGGYDKILLDAPCSSERHIIHAQERATKSLRTAEELSRWSPLMAKRLAETQVKLLQNALRHVKVGGHVLYATCSISSEENDEVVRKVLNWSAMQHKKGTISWVCQIDKPSPTLETMLQSWAERTEQGWIVLPDHETPYGTGWGPLFFALLTKVKS